MGLAVWKLVTDIINEPPCVTRAGGGHHLAILPYVLGFIKDIINSIDDIMGTVDDGWSDFALHEVRGLV